MRVDAGPQHCQATVSAPVLIDLLRPFEVDVWSVGGVTRDQVTSALAEGRLNPEPPERSWMRGPCSAQAHAERIAYLVHHDWPPGERLEVDVTASGAVMLEDGNHRLHALAYLGSTQDVLVAIYGYLDVAEELFGITIDEEECA
jgi:hypothetical protein